MNIEAQRVNLYEPLIADRRGPAPLALRVGTYPQAGYSPVGSVTAGLVVENYVRLSALPEELRAKVELAVQALIAGM
jgi:hypothetical protein